MAEVSQQGFGHLGIFRRIDIAGVIHIPDAKENFNGFSSFVGTGILRLLLFQGLSFLACPDLFQVGTVVSAARALYGLILLKSWFVKTIIDFL